MTFTSRIMASLAGLCLILSTGVAFSQSAAAQTPTPTFLQSEWQTATAQGEVGADTPAFWVRPGYRVSAVSPALEEARFLEIDTSGTLYVSQPGRGAVKTLRLGDDGKYTPIADFVSGLKTAHGLCLDSSGALWITQTGAIHRARDTNGDGKADETKTIIPEGKLPKGGGHWYRSILVSGDVLYTSIGDAGNISNQTDTERQKIWRFKTDGSGKTLFASGLRNTEKLRLRPGTNEVWGADHGSDWFGKEVGDKQGMQPVTDWNPPDEFNHYVEGGFYGHPFIVGDVLPRYEYLDRKDIIDLAARTIPPAWSFGAHWATNAFCFLNRDTWPDHKGDAFVACHGSWNRSRRQGYRIERVMFDKVTGSPMGSQMIVGTIGRDGAELARPVDCVEAPDGSILFSCDTTQRIYRISPIKAKP